MPFIATVLIRLRIASTAAPSAAFLSPAADPAAGGERGRLGEPDQLEGQVAAGVGPGLFDGQIRVVLSHRALLRG